MSTRHSILLGTDAPSSGDRVLEPSAHVRARLDAAEEKWATRRQVDAASGGVHSITTQSDAASGTEDKIIESSVSFEATPASPARSRPGTTSAAISSRGLSASTVSSMAQLNAAFATLRAGGDDALASAQAQLDGSLFAAAVAAATAADSSAQSGSESGNGASKSDAPSVTCFEVVTSSASRVPLASIIAGSGSDGIEMRGGGGGKISNDGSGEARETYMVLTPVDWSVHDAECVFARLTSINRGADASDTIALELAAERDQLEQQLQAARERETEHLRQIRELKQQLEEAKRAAASAASSSTAGASTVSPAAAASLDSTVAASPASNKPAASALPPKIHSDDDTSEEEDDDDMADEEDINAATESPTASSSAAGANTSTFGTQT